MDATVARLIVQLIGDASSFTNMLDSASSAAVRAGKVMSLAITTPIVAMGGASVREFGKFDSAMTESLAIMTTTGDQAQRMRDKALELGSQGIQGPHELAQAYFFLASAGLDAEQAMGALPVVARFATAGAFDLSQATSLLSDSQSALGLKVADATKNMENMARVADVLVRANVLSNASVEEFANALTNKSAAALKNFNKDVEEGVAVLSAMADQGIKAEQAGTGLTRFLTVLPQALRDNEKAYKKFNVEVFDSQGKMRNLADIVASLERATAGMSDEVKSATFAQLGFTAEIAQAIMPLMGTSESIRRYEKELRSATGYTEAVATKQLTSFSSQMRILWNQVKVVAISIGEELAPIILTLSEYLKVGIEWWKTLSSETRQYIILAAAVVAALGPVLVGLGALAASLSAVIGLLTPIAPLVAVAVAAVGGLAAMWLYSSEMASFSLSSMTGWIVGFIGATVSNIGVLLQMMVRLFVAFQGYVAGVWEYIFTIDFVRWVIKGIEKVGELLTAFAVKAWETLVAIFTGDVPGLEAWFAGLDADFQQGRLNPNFLETASNIIAEESGRLQGFGGGATPEARAVPQPSGPVSVTVEGGKEQLGVLNSINKHLERMANNLPRTTNQLVGAGFGSIN